MKDSNLFVAELTVGQCKISKPINTQIGLTFRIGIWILIQGEQSHKVSQAKLSKTTPSTSISPCSLTLID